jgi:hypothetical protein
LRNDDYEVIDAESEGDARRFAVEALWVPLEAISIRNADAKVGGFGTESVAETKPD